VSFVFLSGITSCHLRPVSMDHITMAPPSLDTRSDLYSHSGAIQKVTCMRTKAQRWTGPPSVSFLWIIPFYLCFHGLFPAQMNMQKNQLFQSINIKAVKMFRLVLYNAWYRIDFGEQWVYRLSKLCRRKNWVCYKKKNNKYVVFFSLSREVDTVRNI